MRGLEIYNQLQMCRWDRCSKTLLRKQHWLHGEGCGIVCNKLYGLIYVLKLHVFQQLLKWIVVQSELEDLKWHLIRINHYLKWGELIMIQSKDWIYFDSVPKAKTGSIYFTRYPVLSCEQDKAIWLANLLMNY
jgi:hypothetical protein